MPFAVEGRWRAITRPATATFAAMRDLRKLGDREARRTRARRSRSSASGCRSIETPVVAVVGDHLLPLAERGQPRRVARGKLECELLARLEPHLAGLRTPSRQSAVRRAVWPLAEQRLARSRPSEPFQREPCRAPARAEILERAEAPSPASRGEHARRLPTLPDALDVGEPEPDRALLGDGALAPRCGSHRARAPAPRVPVPRGSASPADRSPSAAR